MRPYDPTTDIHLTIIGAALKMHTDTDLLQTHTRAQMQSDT